MYDSSNNRKRLEQALPQYTKQKKGFHIMTTFNMYYPELVYRTNIVGKLGPQVQKQPEQRSRHC